MCYTTYKQWKTIPLQEPPILSVIIPAYNESDRIVPTIGAIAAHICDLGISWELIIADDGSTDDTVQIVTALELANLHILKAAQNGGKGSAVQRGMLAAHGQYRLFCDADNATPIEEIDKLLDSVSASDCDIAVGSRAVGEAEEANRSVLRQAMSGGLRWLVQHVVRLGISDSQCGFKLFTEEAAKRLYAAQTIQGFSFDLEILYLAQKFGYRTVELPVIWFDAPGSKVNATKEAGRFLRDLFKIKLNDWRGVYHETEIIKQVENSIGYDLSSGKGYA